MNYYERNRQFAKELTSENIDAYKKWLNTDAIIEGHCTYIKFPRKIHKRIRRLIKKYYRR